MLDIITMLLYVMIHNLSSGVECTKIGLIINSSPVRGLNRRVYTELEAGKEKKSDFSKYACKYINLRYGFRPFHRSTVVVT